MAIGILDRLDDAMNPIVVKELRQAVKSHLVVRSLLLFLLLQVVVLGVCLMLQEIRTADGINAQAGQSIFLWLQGIMVGVCMLLVPAYAGVRLAAERSDTNVDLLFISTLKPRSIVWGKFLAAGALVLLIFSAFAPFLTFTYLLRGIDIPTILLVLGMDFLVVMAATMLVIFLACAPTNLILKVVLLLIGLGCVGGLLAATLVASLGIVESAFVQRAPAAEFWSIVGGIGAILLAETGQFFVWAIALINPPSANRAVAVRLYTLVRCLVTFSAAAIIAYTIKYPAPIYVWQGWMLFLFGVHMAMGVSEREHLGPRVARTIPRNVLLRFPLFAFYSGAAGGILFAVLLATFVLVAGPVTAWCMDARFRSVPYVLTHPHDPWHVTFVMTVLALYIYAYGLLGILLRRLFFRHRLRTGFTWLISLIAFTVGCAWPYFIILTIPKNSLQFEQDYKWIMLTNPVAMTIAADSPSASTNLRNFDDVVMGFATVCAAGLTLCCLPWLLRQIEGFRPPKRKAAAAPAAPVPVVVPMVETLGNGEMPPAPTDAVAEPGPVQRARVE
jgi:hypothetical protein